jgi:hypothetical protein
VCFVALCLNLYLQPYRVKADSQFAAIVLFQLFLTLFLGFIDKFTEPKVFTDKSIFAAILLSTSGLVICLAVYFIGSGGIKAGMMQKMQLEVDRKKMVNRLVALKWQKASRTIVVLRAALKITEAAKKLNSTDHDADAHVAVGEVTLAFSDIAERRKRVVAIMGVQRRVMSTSSKQETDQIKHIQIPTTTKAKVSLLGKLKKLLYGNKNVTEDEAAAAGADGQSGDPRMRAAVAGGAVAGVAVVGVAAVVASGHGPVGFGDIHGAFDGHHDHHHDDGGDDFEMDDDGGGGGGFDMEHHLG